MKLDKRNDFHIKKVCKKCNSVHVMTCDNIKCKCTINEKDVNFYFFTTHDCGNNISVSPHELSKDLQEILCFKALKGLNS